MNYILKTCTYISKEDVFSRDTTMNTTLAQTLIKPSAGSRVLAINFWKAYSAQTGETKGKLGLYKWIDTLYTRKRGVIYEAELITSNLLRNVEQQDSKSGYDAELAAMKAKQDILDAECARLEKEVLEKEIASLKQINAILEERNAKLERELVFTKNNLVDEIYKNVSLKKELEEKNEELEDMEEQLDNFAIETEPFDVLEMEEVDVIEHEEEDYATEDEDENAVRICLETIQKKYKDILNKFSEANIEVIQLVDEQISNLSPEVVEAEGLLIAERIINEMSELLPENGEEELYLQQQAEHAEQARIIQQETMERRRQLAMGEIEMEEEDEGDEEDDSCWGDTQQVANGYTGMGL